MTTINTIDDLIKIIREQPEAKEAVRREILTEELLALPQEIAAMARIVRNTAETQEQHTEALSDMARTVRNTAETQEQHTRFLEQHSRDIDDLKTTVKGIANSQEEHTQILNDHSVAIADLKSDVSTLKSDVGELKGLSAFTPAERRYELIAFEMNLEPVRLLSPGDIVRMTMTEAAQEFDQSDLNSFRDCDLIIAARSPSDGDCYITVQVSYTVDHSDISRAIRHAEMVTRFTGRPAFAAVSGVERADVTERRLSTDSVHIHRLPRRSTQPR